MTDKSVILVMSYSDNSGIPSVCPYLLSPRERLIAEWIVEHIMETEVQFTEIERREAESKPGD